MFGLTASRVTNIYAHKNVQQDIRVSLVTCQVC